MKKFLTRCVLFILLSFSACSLIFNYLSPILPTYPILSFIEGKFSEDDGWKISSSSIVDMDTPTKIEREFVEVIDDIVLIYKNDKDEYFKMKPNYYATHGDNLFWTSQAMDSLSAAKKIEIIDEEYFIVDKFLEEVEGRVSIDDEVIANGDIFKSDVEYYTYTKNINETTAIYKLTMQDVYVKFTINEDKSEYLFEISDGYYSIEDAEKEDAENVTYPEYWKNSFKLID